MLNEPTHTVKNGFNADAAFSIRDEQLMAQRLLDKYQDMTPEQAQGALKLEMERWALLKNRLADEISRGSSMTHVATETGLDGASIDAWTKNFDYFRIARYVGSESEAVRIEATLENWFHELDQERALGKKHHPMRIATSVTREVSAAISMSREMIKIVDISAPPGSGKSEGVAEYVAHSRKEEGFSCPVWLIELTEFSLSAKSVLRMIARACISANYDAHDEATIFQDIVNQTTGKSGVLIIEEAQHLGDAKNIHTLKIFNGLRRFVDAKCFGIVLIGNGEIYRRLKNGQQHAQLLSRMESFRVEIPGVSEEDVDHVMAAWGVSGRAERTLCHKMAHGPGALRSLVEAFQRSLRDYGTITLATLNKVPRG